MTYLIDLKQQNQGWAMWQIESAGWYTAEQPQFTVFDITLKARAAIPGLCRSEIIVEQSAPGATLECDPVVVTGNVCTVKQCKFNGGTPVSSISASPVFSVASTGIVPKILQKAKLKLPVQSKKEKIAKKQKIKA